MDENVSLPNQDPALRVVPMPSDANQHGDIFGGWVMSQVDVAGAVPAARRARGRVATVAVNSFVFEQPVLVGDVVSFYATITHLGHRRRSGLRRAQSRQDDLRQGHGGEPDLCRRRARSTAGATAPGIGVR